MKVTKRVEGKGARFNLFQNASEYMRGGLRLYHHVSRDEMRACRSSSDGCATAGHKGPDGSEKEVEDLTSEESQEGEKSVPLL